MFGRSRQTLWSIAHEWAFLSFHVHEYVFHAGLSLLMDVGTQCTADFRSKSHKVMLHKAETQHLLANHFLWKQITYRSKLEALLHSFSNPFQSNQTLLLSPYPKVMGEIKKIYTFWQTCLTGTTPDIFSITCTFLFWIEGGLVRHFFTVFNSSQITKAPGSQYNIWNTNLSAEKSLAEHTRECCSSHHLTKSETILISNVISFSFDQAETVVFIACNYRKSATK